MEGVRGHNTTYGNTGRLGTSAGAVYGTGFNKTAWMAGQNSAVAGTSFDFGTGGSIGTPTSGVSGNHLSGNYGLLGGSSYGVYCGGSLFATGTKSLQIDYPFDPENRVLNHYCTEGPEPQNAYNGVVTLDAHGEAHVELPHYFEEINKDFRYQLTCVGGFAPIYIAHEIENNRFQIAGGTPGLKVSWEVKGVRNDRFVRAYGAPVEQEKLPENRGKYLRPELYGQPKERGQFCPPNPVANAAVESAPRTDPGN